MRAIVIKGNASPGLWKDAHTNQRDCDIWMPYISLLPRSPLSSYKLERLKIKLSIAKRFTSLESENPQTAVKVSHF